MLLCMRITLINIIVIALIVVGIFSTESMNLFWLTCELIILSFSYLVLLKKDWKYLYKLFSKGYILFLIISLALCVYAAFHESSTLIITIRIICYGFISIIILIPTITDIFLVSISKIKFLNVFLEAFILLRNLLLSLINDLLIGILTAPKFRGSNIVLKFRFLGLSTFVLISRAPDIITNLLISTRISKFDSQQLKEISKPSKGLYLFLCVSFTFFITHIILEYVNK